MDMNTVILCGKLAAPPELRDFESGSRLLRILVTVRTEEPRRRVDVVPVTLWNSDTTKKIHPDSPEKIHPDFEAAAAMKAGDRIWVYGSVQRRFWSSLEGRRSRLEVVAASVITQPAETELETVNG